MGREVGGGSAAAAGWHASHMAGLVWMGTGQLLLLLPACMCVKKPHICKATKNHVMSLA